MALWEIIIVCIGLSLDVFAVAVCNGSELVKIRPRRLLGMCGIFCLWQGGALALGMVIAHLHSLSLLHRQLSSFWRTLSALIFLVLAALLILRAIRKRSFLERRSEINFRHVFIAAILTSFDALLTGISSGFLHTRLLTAVIVLLLTTVLAVALGVVTGYYFGYEQRQKAYWCGGALFLVAGVDVIVRYVI